MTDKKAGARLLSETPPPSPDLQHYLDTPRMRLEVLRVFVESDHAGRPVAEAVQQILRPLLELDLEHNSDARKGDIARALGLSSGWAEFNETFHAAAWVKLYREHKESKGERVTWADASDAWKKLNPKSTLDHETIDKMRRRKFSDK